MYIILVLVSLIVSYSCLPPPINTIPEEQAIALIQSLSNWGRWGANDQLGFILSMNFTSIILVFIKFAGLLNFCQNSKHRLEALSMIKEGITHNTINYSVII